MRTLVVLITVLSALGTPRPGQAKPFCFDMGTGKSELRPGFTAVTARSLYTKEAGYGWKSRDGLKEHYQPYSREWTINESRGVAQPDPIYANELTCDSLLSTEPNAFLVDVPDGQYVVYLFCGRSAGSPREYHSFDVVAGQAATSVKIPGPYRFEKRVLRTAVIGGQLAIEFVPKTDWLLAGLVVCTAAEEARVREEFLDALKKEIYFLPPDVAAKWKEIRHVDDRPLPTFSTADKDRGYALFARHYTEVIYPNTVPRQSELDPALAIFASLGEYEPVTFTVLPLKDLPGAKVTAGELRSGEAVIPPGNVDVRYVRTMLVRPNYSTYFSYHVAPDVLEHRDAVDLKRGCNQRFWIP